MQDTVFTLLRDFRHESLVQHVAIDARIAELAAEVASLQRWKAKVLGISFAVSTIVGVAARALPL